MPKAGRAGGYPQEEFEQYFHDAYCDAMTDQAEPLEAKAIEGLGTASASRPSCRGSTSGRSCARRELNQIKPSRVPARRPRFAPSRATWRRRPTARRSSRWRGSNEDDSDRYVLARRPRRLAQVAAAQRRTAGRTGDEDAAAAAADERDGTAAAASGRRSRREAKAPARQQKKARAARRAARPTSTRRSRSGKPREERAACPRRARRSLASTFSPRLAPGAGGAGALQRRHLLEAAARTRTPRASTRRRCRPTRPTARR